MTVISEVELLARLVLAAVFGMLIGLEREWAGHTAGVRTHLLVAVGSALFTEVSFVGFGGLDGEGADSARVAAQVVTGIGFLGAGAILRYGRVVRGLTTAASIWAVAAIGMASATGQYVLVVGATVIILIALAPLRGVVGRTLGTRGVRMDLRARLTGETSVSVLTTALADRGVIVHSVRRTNGDVGVEITLPRRVSPDEIVVLCAELDHVELLELTDDEGDD